jgi:hypothetical protein
MITLIAYVGSDRDQYTSYPDRNSTTVLRGLNTPQSQMLSPDERLQSRRDTVHSNDGRIQSRCEDIIQIPVADACCPR